MSTLGSTITEPIQKVALASYADHVATAPERAAPFPRPRFPAGVAVGPAAMVVLLLAGAVALAAIPMAGPAAEPRPWWPSIAPWAWLAVVAGASYLTLWAGVVAPIRRFSDQLEQVAAGGATERVVRSPIAELDHVAGGLRRLDAGPLGAGPLDGASASDGVRRTPLVLSLGVVATMLLSWTAAAAMAVLGPDPTPAAGIAVAQSRTTLASTADALRDALRDGLAALERAAAAPVTGAVVTDLPTTADGVFASASLFRSVSVVDSWGRRESTAGRPSRWPGVDSRWPGAAPPRAAGIEQVNVSGSEPIVLASAPMWDGVHTLVGEFDPRALNDLIRALGVHTRVVDHGMRVVLDTAGYTAFAPLDDPALHEVARSALSGSPLVAMPDAGGGRAVAAARLTGGGAPADPGWVVVQDQDVALVAFAGDVARRSAIVVIALSAGLAALALVWIQLTVVRPVRQLARHVEQLARGGRTEVLAPQRLDEVGAATAAVNRYLARRR